MNVKHQNTNHYQKLTKSVKDYVENHMLTCIPLQGKKPLLKDWDGWAEKDPTLEEQLKEFERCKNYVTGVGIITSYVHSLAVIDLEVTEDYSKHFLPPCPVVQSGGNGRHYYYDFNFDLDMEDNGISLKSFGIDGDLKLNKGYIIAPPSIHPITGNEYKWIVPLDEFPKRPQLPQWVTDLYKRRKTSSKKVDWASVELTQISEGNRHNTAVSVAGKLLKMSHPNEWEVFTLPMFMAWNNGACVPPLPEEEVMSIFEGLSGKEIKKHDN